MGFLRKIWDWASPLNFLYGDVCTTNGRKSTSTHEAHQVSRTDVKAFKVNAGAGIAPSGDWNPRDANNSDTPLPKQSETSLATTASSSSQTSNKFGRSQQPEGKQAAQKLPGRTDAEVKRARQKISLQIALSQAQSNPQTSTRKATQQDLGCVWNMPRNHSAASGRIKRLEMAKARCERTVIRTQAQLAEGEQKLAEMQRKSALLEKVIALCEKSQSPDADLQAELQALGVHSATIGAIGTPPPLEPEVDNRSVDEILAGIEGPAKQKPTQSTKKLATQQGASKASIQASSVSKPDNVADGGNTDGDDEGGDSAWDCSPEEIMAEVLHPYNPTAGAAVQQLEQMKKTPSLAQCYRAAWLAWEELDNSLFLVAKEFIMKNPRNYDDGAVRQYLLFRRRASRDGYAIDLHTPQSLRDAGRCLTARQASIAAQEWLRLLHEFLVSWIPGQEVTIVTGRGLSTGCRQFVAVGVMLAILQSQGVVARFWPISQNGAYRVVLGVPM